ncbi:MAG: DUF971 domain-containing protein [Bacteroidota bacterium]
MPQPSFRAKRLTVEKEAQTLTIEWADGHVTVFPLDGLRRTCPCASCAGGHENMGKLPDPDLFRVPGLMRWDNIAITPVGGYAISFKWDDGHDAGIYTWERLRVTCPCDVCRAA